ncbi:MAG TPA: hypothetical protein VND87_08890 [Stellaceae bacterium]|nr:hypothetical protein [Stellaceae bacterium]
MSRCLHSIVMAAALCGLATAASAREMSYSYAQSPEENVYLSNRYDRLVETNWAFRQYRMVKECNPIDDDPALRHDCLASFDQYEPWRGGYR